MSAVETVIDTLRSAQLRNGPMTHDEIDNLARKVGGALGATEADIEEIVRKIASENDIRMTAGSTLTAPGWSPWLDERKAEISWDYWERYHQLLLQKGLPVSIISRMDELTDKILGLTENPYKEGAWRRRGLVLGHVQSGKTANYIGLINVSVHSKALFRACGELGNLRSSDRRQEHRDAPRPQKSLPPDSRRMAGFDPALRPRGPDVARLLRARGRGRKHVHRLASTPSSRCGGTETGRGGGAGSLGAGDRRRSVRRAFVTG